MWRGTFRLMVLRWVDALLSVDFFGVGAGFDVGGGGGRGAFEGAVCA